MSGDMDTASHKQVENTIPVLAVTDLERSISFYRRILGFGLEWNEGPVCSVGRDGSSIMLAVRDEPAPGTVWIGLKDDALIQRIANAGMELLEGPSNKPWAYELKIADPDGNTLWLGTEPRPQ